MKGEKEIKVNFFFIVLYYKTRSSFLLLLFITKSEIPFQSSLHYAFPIDLLQISRQ